MTTLRREPRLPVGIRPPGPLTERERAIVALVAEGYTSRAIGVRLGCAMKTVEAHLTNAAWKLDLGGDPERHLRVLLARWWWERGE